MARRRAGQDPARAPPRRAGVRRPDSALPLLRNDRRDAAVRAARCESCRWTAIGALSTTEPDAERRSCGSSATAMRGNGLVRYQRRTTSGLLNQGWKDSEDASCTRRHARHRADRARRGAGLCVGAPSRSRCLRGVGEPDRARALACRPTRSASLQRGVLGPAEGFFALALDGASARFRRHLEPGTLLYAVSCRRQAPGSSTADVRGHVQRLGHAHALARARRSTRCGITTDRCGRTTTRSSPPG